jgi:hypothetical protein
MRDLGTEVYMPGVDSDLVRRVCSSWGRISKIFLIVVMMACLPSVLFAGTISTPLTVTIPTQNFYNIFILCTVPIGSCNESSPIPLILVDFEAAIRPAGSGQDVIHNVNTSIVQSGYLTWIALDQSAPQDVVIGLRTGFVNVGDPWPFSTPESQLATDLLAGGASASADLRSFFLSNLTAFPQVGGTGGTMYRFSTATVVGTIGPTVISPEPAAGALTAFALLTLVLLRCRLPPLLPVTQEHKRAWKS